MDIIFTNTIGFTERRLMPLPAVMPLTLSGSQGSDDTTTDSASQLQFATQSQFASQSKVSLSDYDPRDHRVEIGSIRVSKNKLSGGTLC